MKPVLVVGEDASFRRYVRLTLQHAGYAALETRLATEAAALIQAETPAALVYDCSLGDRGDVLRAELAQVGFDAGQVIWVTSGLGGERPSGPRVLVKPFDPGELVGLLENVLQKPAA